MVVVFLFMHWYKLNKKKRKKEGIAIRQRPTEWSFLDLTLREHIPNKVKSETIVDGDPKAPFSIATTPRCRGRALLSKGLLKGLKDLEVGDHPIYSIMENGENDEKSSGDLRRLAVTQTSAKDHQLTLMWKTLKE